jgi:peptidyl-prolyl cis-trans isomerase SurA
MSFNSWKGASLVGKSIWIAVLLLLCGSGSFAQETADKIIAVVGKNRIILKSDLDIQIAQELQQNPVFHDTCGLLQSMVQGKMMLEQAERDSVMVNDDDVEGNLDNRLRYFVQMYGSKEKLEQAAGKTVYQLKEEYRDAIREQMVTEKMRAQILENVKITPAEVTAFYKKIPTDSLPFFPATIEVGQIVIDPPVSEEMNDYARKKLSDIRKEIVDSVRTFEYEVATNSDDPGSRDNGGRYDGITRNGPYAPEFVAAAFKLQNGEISPVFKTKFGYHIIQMIQRKGDEVDVRHILIKPEVTSGDFKKAMTKLDSVRNLLVTGKITFPEAVGKFSTDEAAKRTGGMIADPATGVTELDMTKLDPAMVLMIDTLKPGHYSAPHIFMTDMHDKSCRIVYLRSRTSPHRANIKDDYSRLQELSLFQKKVQKLMNWTKDKLPGMYIWLSPEYRSCTVLNDWMTIASGETAGK